MASTVAKASAEPAKKLPRPLSETVQKDDLTIGKRKRLTESDDKQTKHSEDNEPATQKRKIQCLVRLDPRTGKTTELPANRIAFLFPPPRLEKKEDSQQDPKPKKVPKVYRVQPAILKSHRGLKRKQFRLEDFEDILDDLIPAKDNGVKTAPTLSLSGPTLQEAAQVFDKQILGQNAGKGFAANTASSQPVDGAKRSRDGEDAADAKRIAPFSNLNGTGKESKPSQSAVPSQSAQATAFVFGTAAAAPSTGAAAAPASMAAAAGPSSTGSFTFGASSQPFTLAGNSGAGVKEEARPPSPTGAAFVFGSSPALSTASKPFTFGAPATGAEKVQTTAQVKSEPQTAAAFVSSQPAQNTTAPASSGSGAPAFTFGAAQPGQSAPGFGTPTPSASGPAQSFGAASFGGPAQPSTAPQFAFGNPSSSAGGFTFGSSSNATPPQSTSQQAQSSTPKIVFGAAGTQNASATASGGSPGGFAKSTTPAFGGAGASTPSFGGGSTTPSFGSGTGMTFGASSASGFGNPSSAPAFGQPNLQSAAGSSAPAFAFGSRPAQTTQSSFSTTTASAFGSGNSSFGASSGPAFGQTAFGGSTPAFGGSGSSAFGAPHAALGGSAPAFGATNSTFGGPSTAFGASSSGFGGNQASSSGFGNAATPTFGGGSTSAFGGNSAPSFGGNSAPAFGAAKPPVFGGASSSGFGSSAPVQFGSSANSTSGASSTAFGAPQSAGAFGQSQFGNTQPSFGSGMTFGASSGARPAQPQTPTFGGGGVGGMTMGNTSNQPARRRIVTRRNR